MAYHVKRSPSQAKRFSKCVGALALCEALPDWARGNSSDAARLGTAAHGVVEHCLKHSVDPETLRDRIVELVGEDENAVILKKGAKAPKRSSTWYVINDEIIEPVTVMTDYVNRRLEELKEAGVAYSLELETRTNPLPERDDTSGTADVTISALDWSFLEVVDYKNGWNVVEHIDNDQLRAYLLGKAIEYDFKHKRYMITIVQPNAEHDEGAIRTFHMKAADLKRFQVEYRATIKKNEEAESHRLCPTKETLDDGVNKVWARKFLNAGPDAEHCMFCDAAGSGKCPARLAFAGQAAQMDFADEPEEMPAPGNANEAAAILAWREPMLRLFGQALAYVQGALENGFTAPGYKLVHSKTNRTRREDMTEAEWVAGVEKEFNVPAKVMYQRKLKTGPQIEKLVPRKERERYSAEFLTKPEGRLVVAPESDSREGVAANAGSDFDDLDFDFDNPDDMDFG